MDIIIEILFRNFLTHFVGLNTRYWIFQLFGIKKTRRYLAGEEQNDNVGSFSQNILNAIVGIILIVLFSFIIAWIVYK
ncbi:MAG: hypothetical protein OIF50_03180 [Flavobacteriaceae bacterium]|nr:hypothetical protein [Flavobacteriaceae bacterium]